MSMSIDLEKQTGESTTEVMLQEQEEKEFNEDVFEEGELDKIREENGGVDDFTFKGLDGKEYNLTLKQKLFCIAFLEEHGNGVEAIIKAGYEVRYKDDKGEPIAGAYNRKLAAVMSAENLRKPSIYSYINLKLEEYGYTDDHVDKQLLFLINQGADFKTKLGGIKEYNKLKGRITDKMDLTSKGQKILGIQMVVPEGATVPQHGANTDTPATA